MKAHSQKWQVEPRKLIIPGIMMLIFWALGITLWLTTGHFFALLNFAYIGTSIGVGLGLWAVLPKPKKPVGRRLTQFLVGGYMLVLVGFISGENIQIEGLFFSILGGITAAASIHYMVAKIIGPLGFGRFWCGWACWTAAVLDLLPFKRPAGRVPGKWGWLRYVHFAGSLALVMVMWFFFDFSQNVFYGSAALLFWFLIGNLAYYAIGIGLAFALKDNRAFCKYVCPVVVPLKLASRFSVLKIEGDLSKCNDCGACMKICPMNIQITDYMKNNERVLSTECILCQTCISACAKNALKISAGLDVGGKERLREAPTPLIFRR
jgi:ferredoxin-type protein NapH